MMHGVRARFQPEVAFIVISPYASRRYVRHDVVLTSSRQVDANETAAGSGLRMPDDSSSAPCVRETHEIRHWETCASLADEARVHAGANRPPDTSTRSAQSEGFGDVCPGPTPDSAEPVMVPIAPATRSCDTPRSGPGSAPRQGALDEGQPASNVASDHMLMLRKRARHRQEVAVLLRASDMIAPEIVDAIGVTAVRGAGAAERSCPRGQRVLR